jgi:hypothetical protein
MAMEAVCASPRLTCIGVCAAFGQKQIEAGESEEKIRQSWQADLKKYQIMRSKYLLYEDF